MDGSIESNRFKTEDMSIEAKSKTGSDTTGAMFANIDKSGRLEDTGRLEDIEDDAGGMADTGIPLSLLKDPLSIDPCLTGLLDFDLRFVNRLVLEPTLADNKTTP